MKEYICKFCKSKFLAKISSKRIYCSKICSTKCPIRKEKIRKFHLGKRRDKSEYFKGFHITSSGYKNLYIPEKSNRKSGHILEHRYVMMKKLGRKLRKDEIIHHINGNKIDNRIENLQIISRYDIGKAPKLNTECPRCHYLFRTA